MADQLKSFNLALEQLRSGNVVAIPTETVYGLAADISNPQALHKIFSVKERPFFDPLIVHLSDIEEVASVAEIFPPLAKTLAEKFWPGPLTIVLPKRSDINPIITSGLETVGMRVPRNKITRELIKKLGSPLAAPSANKFGHTSPTTAEHVKNEFSGSVMVLDDGPCEVGVESTVIGFNENFSEIYIYRPGAITKEMLEPFAPVFVKMSPAAPGQLKHHYMPNLPLVILSTQEHLTVDLYAQLTSALGVHALYPSWMSLSDEPNLAARLLYEKMRNAVTKSPQANCILLRYHLHTSPSGIDAAIVDRLQKAAKIIV